MRIRVYSDLHLEFAPFVPPPSDADVIVLAGDIDNGAAGIEWAREAFGKPVLYLAGNHEYYEGEFEAVQEAMGAAARKCSIELLDCSGAVLDGVQARPDRGDLSFSRGARCRAKSIRGRSPLRPEAAQASRL